MVLGICSLVSVGGWFVVPIVGLILGVIGKKKAEEAGAPTGMAMAGIIMSIIALVISVISAIACVACLGALNNDFDDFYHFDTWY